MAGRAGAAKTSFESSRAPSSKDLKDQKKRRRALEEQRELRRKKAERIYDQQAGSPDKALEESQVQDFVARVLEIDSQKLEPHAVQLVIDTAKKSPEDKTVDKQPLIDAIERTGE